jgi:hypothetical protein
MEPAWGAVNRFVLERDQSLSLRPVVHRPSQHSDHGRGNPSEEDDPRPNARIGRSWPLGVLLRLQVQPLDKEP